MPAEFEIIKDRVCLVRYTDPLLAKDIYQSFADIMAYAQSATQPVLAIGDYTAITQLSRGLISAGVRPGSANPLRNPLVEKIVVIADLPIIMSLAAVVSKILGIEKLVVVRTQAQADYEVERFLRKHNLG